VWDITQPFLRNAADDRLEEKIITPVSKITAAGIAAFSAADLADYGLKDPYAEVALTTLPDGKEIGFKVVVNNNSWYILFNNAVFNVPKTAVEFVDTDPFYVAEKFIALISIDSVSSVEIGALGESFTLSHNTKDGADEYAVNGETIAEKQYKKAYQAVIGLSADGMTDGTVTRGGAPVGVITYNLLNGAKEVIEFYEYDELNCAAFRNAEGGFYMKRKQLRQMVESLQEILLNR
jgi:hypothetical protein